MLANMAVEVAIGAFRHAKWPMDVKGERLGHAPPPTRFRPPRQRPNRRPAVQLCSRLALLARMSTGQSAVAAATPASSSRKSAGETHPNIVARRDEQRM